MIIIQSQNREGLLGLSVVPLILGPLVMAVRGLYVIGADVWRAGAHQEPQDEEEHLQLHDSCAFQKMRGIEPLQIHDNTILSDQVCQFFN